MNLSLSPWFRLNRFTVGRRLFAIAHLRQRALDRGLTGLVDRCDRALVADREQRELERRYRADKNVRVDPRLTALDPQIDKLVGAIARLCAETAESLPGTPEAAAAKRILDELFPSGIAGVTSLAYVDQASEVAALIETLAPGGRLSAEAALAGVDRQVARLAALSAEFTALLPAGGPEVVRFDQVRAGQAQGDERLLAIVAWICGHFPDPESAQTREALLEPIRVQNEAIRAYLSARRGVTDVHPTTGEELTDAPVPSPAEAAPPEPVA